MTLLYVLLAFIVGLLLGWFLWGRLRGELDGLRKNLEDALSERDRLSADKSRLGGELDACTRARADLDRQLQEARKSSPAATQSSRTASRSKAAPLKLVTSTTDQATKARASKPKTSKPSGKDNLRRLIGIGPVNERKLNEHGITTFAQIAAWRPADVKQVEDYLEFDGRIERERWVEQAKLLATGDEKEFARRFPTAGSSNNT